MLVMAKRRYFVMMFHLERIVTGFRVALVMERRRFVVQTEST
jgi:hypothetical protein